jgi:inorganic triphosphatase YgiF
MGRVGWWKFDKGSIAAAEFREKTQDFEVEPDEGDEKALRAYADSLIRGSLLLKPEAARR